MDREIIVPAGVDPTAWRAETERLGPILRRASREVWGGGGSSSIPSTWHHHIEHLHALANQVSAVMPALRQDTTGLVGVLRVDLDAVDRREELLRRRIVRLDLHEVAYRDARTTLDEVNSRRLDAEERVSSLTHELAGLTEKCTSTAIAVDDYATGTGGGGEGATSGYGQLTRVKDATRDMTLSLIHI